MLLNKGLCPVLWYSYWMSVIVSAKSSTVVTLPSTVTLIVTLPIDSDSIDSANNNSASAKAALARAFSSTAAITCFWRWEEIPKHKKLLGDRT